MTEILSEVPQGTAIAEYSETEAALATLRGKYQGTVFAVATVRGNKEARAARLELVTLRTGLDKKRKALKEPALEYSRRIDSEAKRITLEVVALEEPISAQIAADEQRREAERAEQARIEVARIETIHASIAVIRAKGDVSPGTPSDQVDAKWHEVDSIEVTLEQFGEFAGTAEVAKRETMARLQKQFDVALAAEEQARAQKAEADRLAAEREQLAQERREQAEHDRKARAEQQTEARRLEKQRADLKAEEERIAALRVASEPAPAPQPVAADLNRLERLMELQETPQPEPRVTRAQVAAGPMRHPVKPERPSDDEIIEVLALHYQVHESKVISWLLEVDLDAATERTVAHA